MFSNLFRLVWVSGALVVALGAILLLTNKPAAPDTGPSAAFHKASTALIDRVTRGNGHIFKVEAIDKENNLDVFEIETLADQVVLRGSSPVAIASALNEFLQRSGQAHLSWGGDRMTTLSVPQPFNKVRKRSRVQLFYNYNFTAHGYSTPYWSWSDWEREIDLLALNGVTHPLIISGIESVYIKTLSRFGYTEAEVRDWLVLPAHLPWQLMGNMHSDDPILNPELVAKRATLGRQILDRMRELGMQPVLPGFYGVVPDDFQEKSRAAGFVTDTKSTVIDQGEWVGGYQRPPLLNPVSPLFPQVAASYYQAIEEVFGRVNFYAADPFHEGGKTAGIDVPAAAEQIQSAMLAHHPNAVWVLQAWQNNPRDEVLSALNKEQALVTDLWGDEDPAWDRNGADVQAFQGVPWAWLAIQNFGGNVGMTGNLDTLAQQFAPTGVFNHPDQTNLIGLGLAMEGIRQNPVVMDFVSFLRWRGLDAGAINLQQWLPEYSIRRYGSKQPGAMRAWQLLGETVYRAGPHRREGTIESIFTARPSFAKTNASSWGPKYGPYYDEQKLQQALAELLSASDELSDIPTYQYDLVDLCRQVLANHGRTLHQAMKQAFAAADIPAFERNKQMFLQLILDQDQLLLSEPEFRLSTWLQKARSFAASAHEADQLEYNARKIITSWSFMESDLQDYSSREWAGLLKDYYHVRWSLWLDYQSAVLAEMEVTEPDLWLFESDWLNNKEADIAPASDKMEPVKISKALYKKYID